MTRKTAHQPIVTASRRTALAFATALILASPGPAFPQEINPRCFARATAEACMESDCTSDNVFTDCACLWDVPGSGLGGDTSTPCPPGVTCCWNVPADGWDTDHVGNESLCLSGGGQTVDDVGNNIWIGFPDGNPDVGLCTCRPPLVIQHTYAQLSMTTPFTDPTFVAPFDCSCPYMSLEEWIAQGGRGFCAPDVDGDKVADDDDNCRDTPNADQTDADGDDLGDVCDFCTGGVGMTKPQLKLGKLLDPAGDDQLQAQGTLSFTGPLPLGALAVHQTEMRIEIVDLGRDGAPVLNQVLPGGLVPNPCGPKDGWKVNGAGTSAKFVTKTNSVPAACAPDSADGIVQAQAKDQTAKNKGATFKLQGKNGSYGPAVGPFRMTVVLGDSPAGLNGQCATHTFAGADCTIASNGSAVTCK